MIDKECKSIFFFYVRAALQFWLQFDFVVRPFKNVKCLVETTSNDAVKELVQDLDFVVGVHALYTVARMKKKKEENNVRNVWSKEENYLSTSL